MQKQLGKVGKASSRSTKKVEAKKVAPKKPASASKKPAAKKSTRSLARIRVNRLSIPPIPWENRTSVLAPVNTPAPETPATATEHPGNTTSPSPLMPWKDQTIALNTTASAPPRTSTVPAKETTSIAPSRALTLWENQTHRRRATDVAIPQTSPAHSAKLWKRALMASRQIPSRFLSIFGWHTYQRPVQQKRMVLQMLIVSGSVRPCNVEFRYSAIPEEAGSLSRAFAITPPSDSHPSTPLQMFLARSQAGGAQLIERLRVQESYARLYSRGIQFVERLRRELTVRSYFSRICVSLLCHPPRLR